MNSLRERFVSALTAIKRTCFAMAVPIPLTGILAACIVCMKGTPITLGETYGLYVISAAICIGIYFECLAIQLHRMSKRLKVQLEDLSREWKDLDGQIKTLSSP